MRGDSINSTAVVAVEELMSVEPDVPSERPPEQVTSEIAKKIGRTLRRIRLEQGLNLGEVSKGANVSRSFIGALERGETDIAIGRLERIVDFLKADLVDVLGYSRQEVRFNLLPKDDFEVVRDEDGVYCLSGRVPGTSTTVVQLSLQPGGVLDVPLASEGMVTVTVVSGHLRIEVADRVFHLRPRDCGSFRAYNPHNFANEGKIETRAVIICTH
jgi:transcriptional regulator with XRE-family HTH domain